MTEDIKVSDSKKYSTRYCLTVFAIISVVMMLYMVFRRALIDDGAFHIGRLYALADELSFINLKPWMYTHTYLDTGYPLGIFYPDLFLYPFAIITKLGMDVYYSFLLFLIAINFASVVSMYYVTKKILSAYNVEAYERIAFVTGIIYFAFPYRVYDLCLRMAIGEAMAFIFLPLIVLGVFQIFYQNKLGISLFFGMTGLVYSHLLSAAMAAVILVVFYLLSIKRIVKNPKIIVNTLINAVFSVLCSLAVILPILEMQSFTKMYYQTGIKSFGLLEENCLGIVSNDIISLVITVVVTFICLFFAIKLSVNGRLIIASLYIVFMCTDAFCWGFLESCVPALNNLQFPYRFLIFTGLTLSYLFGRLLYIHTPLYTAIPAMIVCGLIFIGYVKYLPIDDIDLYGIYSAGRGEYLNNDLRNYFGEHNYTLDEIYETYNIKADDNSFTFEPKDGNVILPKGYYKGYEIRDEKGNTYKYTHEDGMIKIENVKGNTLTADYGGTVIQKASLWTSVISFCLICLGSAVFKRKEKSTTV